MRRIVIAAMAMLAAAYSAEPARAAEADGSFAVDGIGIWTCQRYLDERAAKSNYYFMFGGWLDGYLTAINSYSPDTYDLTPWETTDLLLALIERNCKKHLEDPFVAMVRGLAKKLRETRLPQTSPVIDAVVGSITIKLYQVTMAQVQQALFDGGFYSGSADGQFGPNTQKAIEAFQTVKSIPVTGLPDQITLLALLRPAQAAAEP
ncbi:MAG: peptidoglycan-binding domain-containing protein [Alphaproteobacteria bacterium]